MIKHTKTPSAHDDRGCAVFIFWVDHAISGFVMDISKNLMI